MPNTPTPNIGLNKPAQGDIPWDATINGNMDKLDSLLSGGTNVPNIALGGTLTKVAGIPTIGAGVPALVAKADLTAQAANVGSTLLYAVPASGAGMYRISFYLVLTQAATVSSTLPSASVAWTDNDTSVGNGFQVTVSAYTGNTLGVSSSELGGLGQATSTLIMNAKASTNINYSTAGYASSGATPMQYAVHVKLEYLGP